MMLIHSPQPWAQFRDGEHFFEGNLQAWRALVQAYRAGKLRATGVSNFEPADLDNLIANSDVAPMVDQVLAHIGNVPWALIEHCRRHDILVQAYSPVVHGAILGHADLGAMAERYGVDVARLGIRYCLQLGLQPLPKTANPDHMRSNAAVDFEISPADMETLGRLAPKTDYGEANRFPVFGKTTGPTEPIGQAGTVSRPPSA